MGPRRVEMGPAEMWRWDPAEMRKWTKQDACPGTAQARSIASPNLTARRGMACIDLRSKAYRVGATNLRHPAVVKGAPRSDVNTNGDGGSWSRLSRRRARSSTPLNGWTDGAPFLARLTWIWPSPAGSKARRRNRPCLGRPKVTRLAWSPSIRTPRRWK